MMRYLCWYLTFEQVLGTGEGVLSIEFFGDLNE